MFTRATTRVLGLLCLMYFITYVDRVNVSTAAIQFGKEFSHSNTQVGFVFSAFAYAYLLFQIIGGWIGDVAGNWDWPFIGSMALMFVGAMLASRWSRQRSFDARRGRSRVLCPSS